MTGYRPMPVSVASTVILTRAKVEAVLPAAQLSAPDETAQGPFEVDKVADPPVMDAVYVAHEPIIRAVEALLTADIPRPVGDNTSGSDASTLTPRSGLDGVQEPLGRGGRYTRWRLPLHAWEVVAARLEGRKALR